MKTAAWTVSGSLTARPMYSENVTSANPEHDRHDHHEHGAMHAVVRVEADGEHGDGDHDRLQAEPDAVAHRAPEQEPERATGSDRKRSIMPVCMSSAIPMPDWMPANTIVCTRTAGTTKSLYVRPVSPRFGDRAEHGTRTGSAA